MSSNYIPVLRLNENQSLNEHHPKQTCQKLRSHSFNPGSNDSYRVSLNNFIPEVHNLNNRLDQLLKKYRSFNNSYLEIQTLDEIKTAYQSQFLTFHTKLEKAEKEKTNLEFVNNSLNRKLSNLEKNISDLKNDFERSVLSLKLELDENCNKMETSKKEWQQKEKEYESEIEKTKNELVDEKKNSVSLQTRIYILEENNNFLKSVFEKEIAEYKRISEMNHKTVENKVRDELEGQFEVFKEELLQKIAEEKKILSENLKRCHANKISQMEASIKNIERRKKDIEDELQEVVTKNEKITREKELMEINYKKNLQKIEEEIREKIEENKSLCEEIENLQRVFEIEIEEKANIEIEIKKYKQIIENAEKNINITPISNTSSLNYSPEVENNQQQQNQNIISPIISSSLIDSGEKQSTKKRKRIDIQLETNPDVNYRNGKFSIEYDANETDNNGKNSQKLVSIFNFIRKKK